MSEIIDILKIINKHASCIYKVIFNVHLVLPVCVVWKSAKFVSFVKLNVCYRSKLVLGQTCS